MSIVALVFAAAAIYYSAVAFVNGRATARFARAASLYAAGRRDAADAEMEQGRNLARRADRMLAPWRSRGKTETGKAAAR